MSERAFPLFMNFIAPLSAHPVQGKPDNSNTSQKKNKSGILNTSLRRTMQKKDQVLAEDSIYNATTTPERDPRLHLVSNEHVLPPKLAVSSGFGPL